MGAKEHHSSKKKTSRDMITTVIVKEDSGETALRLYGYHTWVEITSTYARTSDIQKHDAHNTHLMYKVGNN